jgi:hypothetical protein
MGHIRRVCREQGYVVVWRLMRQPGIKCCFALAVRIIRKTAFLGLKNSK